MKIFLVKRAPIKPTIRIKSLYTPKLRLLCLIYKYPAPKVSELVPQNVMKYKTLNGFKTKIKSWYRDLVRVGSAKAT